VKLGILYGETFFLRAGRWVLPVGGYCMVLETRDSLLANPDPRSESFWDTTEIEAAVQIPTCRMMVRREELRLHPKCIWMNVSASHRIEVNLIPLPQLTSH
jgi:hypothetical protein